MKILYHDFSYQELAEKNDVAEKYEQEQAHIFQDIFSESCKIHQLAILYHFGHKNHDFHINVSISKSLQTLFTCV